MNWVVTHNIHHCDVLYWHTAEPLRSSGHVWEAGHAAYNNRRY